MKLERLNVNDDEYVLRTWLVAEGQHVETGAAIVEVETSKTAVEVEATASGRIKFLAGPGQTVRVGELICIIGEGAAKVPPPAVPQPVAPPARPEIAGTAAQARPAPAGASPARGFVTSRPYQKQTPGPEVARPRDAKPVMPGLPDKRKAAEIANLSVVNPAGLVSCLFRSIDAGTRSHPVGGIFENNISDLIVYECARLVAKYPKINAVFDPVAGLKHADAVRFGYSVDVDDDLAVYNLGACDGMTLEAVRSRIEACIEAHVLKKVPRDLMAETTITLSDLSGSGLDSFVPLVNGAQSCILGYASPTPRTAKLSLAFDHRVLGGKYASLVLDELARRVQSHFAGPPVPSCDYCGTDMAGLRKRGERGLLRIVSPAGRDGLSCRNCYENW